MENLMKIKVMPVFVCLMLPAVANAQSESAIRTEVIDPAGTEIVRDSSHSEKRGLLGTKTTTSTSEITVDPKGLNNKTSRKVESETKVTKDGDVTERTTSLDEAGTERSVSRNTETTKADDGTVTTKRKEEMEVDPKGLGNKQSVEVEETVAKSPDGKVTSRVKKLNGETVAKESFVK